MRSTWRVARGASSRRCRRNRLPALSARGHLPFADGNIATTAFREASCASRSARRAISSIRRSASYSWSRSNLLSRALACRRARAARAARADAREPAAAREGAAQTRNQLAVLIGKFPDETRLPSSILRRSSCRRPSGQLPSDLVRQRRISLGGNRSASDERAHRRAQALMFPQLTLSGSFGTPRPAATRYSATRPRRLEHAPACFSRFFTRGSSRRESAGTGAYDRPSRSISSRSRRVPERATCCLLWSSTRSRSKRRRMPSCGGESST